MALASSLLRAPCSLLPALCSLKPRYLYLTSPRIAIDIITKRNAIIFFDCVKKLKVTQTVAVPYSEIRSSQVLTVNFNSLRLLSYRKRTFSTRLSQVLIGSDQDFWENLR
ncbi:hypothetical protein [Moorena sp. SIO3H5]|uniref:hypothetical protein n=1 Tax=Moorena sp. SIO3H5 TaxID=2607834 RepID=UPI0013B6D2DD|nr:hypothetical protein [Moorena sp. SIO3H5]NEO70914.1 hypothetical protein [Moorena sp. SIO3H5]